MLTGKVFITGGSGFLGRGIMRRALSENWPCDFTVYSRDEYKQDLCRRKFPNAHYILGDTRDRDNLGSALVGHDIVIHAAALKYIPEAEINVGECIGTNVLGTMSLISACKEAGVNKVVGISTDKAVQPVNVYGMTKALQERLFAEAADRSNHIKFTSCRYGNVVGSTGSVIPMFMYQKEKFGRLQVTDPDMTRFWISVDEAIDLIVFALGDDRFNGSISIPKPKAMTLMGVATAVAGLTTIDVVGPRPGEKTHESLLAPHESLRVISYEKYYELLPSPHKTNLTPLFELVSSSPHAWMTVEEMRELIVDAGQV